MDSRYFMNPENQEFIKESGIEKFRKYIEEMQKKIEEKYPLQKNSSK